MSWHASGVADTISAKGMNRRDFIAMIDETLNELGEFGEVRLIVQKGRLRFVITQQSFDALKWTTREPALERSE